MLPCAIVCLRSLLHCRHFYFDTWEKKTIFCCPLYVNTCTVQLQKNFDYFFNTPNHFLLLLFCSFGHLSKSPSIWKINQSEIKYPEENLESVEIWPALPGGWINIAKAQNQNTFIDRHTFRWRFIQSSNGINCFEYQLLFYMNKLFDEDDGNERQCLFVWNCFFLSVT